jgi:protein-tyrosine phosphatase
VGYFDLHSHVLPAVDEGAADEAASLAMLRGLASIGFDTVCATPHQRAGLFMAPREAIAAAHSATRDLLAANAIHLALPLAAENMWDGVFYERSCDGTIPSYDDGRAFLVEFPVTALPIGVFDRLFQFRLEGKLPVLAHPERYQPLWSDPDAVLRLRESCALVVDLGALAGYHGRKSAKLARRLVAEGLAHAAASDAHNPNDVRVAAEGIAWIRKQQGEVAVTRLLAENPRRIFAGEHPDS